MNAADRRRLTPALGILAVLLAALLIALWAGVGRGAHWHDNAAPPPLPPARAATPPPSVPPLENFANVWEKPLFNPDRKPIAAPAGGTNNANTGDLELTGVIMLPGLHIALLREKNSGRTLRVREGQNANGAAVVEVKPRSAVVDINGSRTELPLKVGPAPGNRGAAVNVPQPQPMEQQNGEIAPPEQQSASPEEGAPAVSPPEQPSPPQPQPQPQSGSSPQQVPPANSSQQPSNLDKDAAEAWAKALKARIQQRRNRAAKKQDANKQDDGG
jgi:general secretion pathway protein N